MNYDLLLLCHPKDYTKLYFCLRSCLDYLEPKPSNFYVVSPYRIAAQTDLEIHSILDQEALPGLNPEEICYRPNWVFKQLINLCQDITQNDIYLTVDCDLIFNRQIELFDDSGRPKFFISDREQRRPPYLAFMQKAFNLDWEFDRTFINDFMMMDKSVCREIIPDARLFFDKFCKDGMSQECHLAEYEVYGNYVTKHHPERYSVQDSKTQLNGKNGARWEAHEIESVIMQNKDQDLDLFTIHTWI